MKRVCVMTFLSAFALFFLVAPEAFAFCEQEKICPNGSLISCLGTTCSSGINWIQCDSHRVYCPNTSACNVTITCPFPYPPYRLGCYSPNGGCSSTATSVTCGGTSYSCAQCQSGTIACQGPIYP